jgi:Novel STAND NTPase 1
MPMLLRGLCAPSGAGKSSLLMGGLVPELRAQGSPVALVRHPHEEGLAERLIGDLLSPPYSPGAGYPGFVDRLLEVERLAGETAVLVLDQFEEVLRPEASRQAQPGASPRRSPFRLEEFSS